MRRHMTQETCKVYPVALVQLLHWFVKQVGIASASVVRLKRDPHRLPCQAERPSHDSQMQMLGKDSLAAGSRRFFAHGGDSTIQPSHFDSGPAKNLRRFFLGPLQHVCRDFRVVVDRNGYPRNFRSFTSCGSLAPKIRARCRQKRKKEQKPKALPKRLHLRDQHGAHLAMAPKWFSRVGTSMPQRRRASQLRMTR